MNIVIIGRTCEVSILMFCVCQTAMMYFCRYFDVNIADICFYV